MGWRLPIEVVNRIKLRLDLDEHVPDIAAALKVLKVIVYKLQLNWDLWDQLYTPPGPQNQTLHPYVVRPTNLLVFCRTTTVKDEDTSID